MRLFENETGGQEVAGSSPVAPTNTSNQAEKAL